MLKSPTITFLYHLLGLSLSERCGIRAGGFRIQGGREGQIQRSWEGGAGMTILTIRLATGPRDPTQLFIRHIGPTAPPPLFVWHGPYGSTSFSTAFCNINPIDLTKPDHIERGLCGPNAGLMLGRRCQRRPSIEPAFGLCLNGVSHRVISAYAKRGNVLQFVTVFCETLCS